MDKKRRFPGIFGGQILTVSLALSLGAVAYGVIFALGPMHCIVLVLIALFFAPVFVAHAQKNRCEKQVFQEVNIYLEQMMYSFQQTEKVLPALKSILPIFEQGKMHTLLSEAVESISRGRLEPGAQSPEEGALKRIASAYGDNRYLHRLHRFMLDVQHYGGNFEETARLILKERELWEERIGKLMDLRRQKRLDVLLSVLLALGLVGIMLRILPQDVDITKHPLVRMSNVAGFFLGLLIYCRADGKLAVSLVSDGKPNNEKLLLRAYEAYVNFNASRAWLAGIRFAAFPGMLAFASLIGQRLGVPMLEKYGIFFFLLLLGAAIFLLLQHQIGHYLDGVMLKQELNLAFPQWLMAVALTLQTDNVQVAIMKTAQDAPIVLKKELDVLIRGFVEQPESPEPYLTFCRSFGISNITNSMQMLYALSSGNGANASRQIASVIRQNEKILHRAQLAAQDREMAGLYLLFLAPVLVSSGMLMLDLMVFLVEFLTTVKI